MILNIRAKGFSLTDSLKGSVESHLCLILNRHKDIIQKVDVMLMDINGPNKGGIDKRCSMTLKLNKFKSIAVQVTELDMYEAIQNCSHKLHSAMIRHLGKKKRINRRQIRMSNLPLEVA